jgi:hypothetical protein
VKFVDVQGSEWEASRRWMPWEPRIATASRLKGTSLFDESNDPVGFAVDLAIVIIMLFPMLLELVVELLVLPFAIALRSVGVLKTLVQVRCTLKVVGSESDGSKIVENQGTRENWVLPVAGFGRARRLRDALADLVRQHGRSAGTDTLAAHWMAHHPR